jgi:hypothetical protein
MNTISTLILSKTAWGSKQAKEAFGIKLPKTNMSSQDVLELIALDKASVKSEVVHVFVLELLNQISLKNTNFSKEVGEEVLKRTWNEALVAGLSGEDKRIVKEVIITVQKKLTSNNGRNIVLLLINKTVLDILEVAA